MYSLFRFIHLFYMSALSAYTPACQKRASDPITDGCKSPCGCWKLTSGPLKKQPVLLTAEPSIQSLVLFLTWWTDYVAGWSWEVHSVSTLPSKCALYRWDSKAPVYTIPTKNSWFISRNNWKHSPKRTGLLELHVQEAQWTPGRGNTKITQKTHSDAVTVTTRQQCQLETHFSPESKARQQWLGILKK